MWRAAATGCLGLSVFGGVALGACGDDESQTEPGTAAGAPVGGAGGTTSGTGGGAPPDDAGTDSSAGGGPTVTECSAYSPCYYVTPTGSGTADGSSWSNAYAGLPSDEVHPYADLPIARLERGATYLLADGTYPGYVLDDPGSGDGVVTIRKATIADHGDDAGFEDSMGDGEALFQSDGAVLLFSPGAKHFLIDGQVGSGKSPGGYGFRLFTTVPRSEGTYLVNIDSSGLWDDVGDVSFITFAHVEFDWDNGTPSGPCGHSAALQVAGPRPSSDWTVTDCYIHHALSGAAYLRTGSRFAFRNTYFYLMGDETEGGDCPDYGGHAHWETFWVTIESDLELIGNTFENAYAPGQTGWVMLEATNVLIEDNLFFCSEPDACAVGGNGVIGAWSQSVNHDVLITHNTFRDFFDGAHFLFEQGTNIVIVDNVYENAPGLEDNQ